MIRFMPDTWWEALFRPLAMIAPDSHVYVEFSAADWRFAFALCVLVALLLYRVKVLSGPVGLLLAFTTAGFAMWVATSGNGRYFLPFLLFIGPLAIGLVSRLPASRFVKLSAALAIVAIQGGLVWDNPPFRAWALTTWKEPPYFQIDIPDDLKREPASFVTITSISYSLVYPQFHPDSRWVNISNLSGDLDRSPIARDAHALFASSRNLLLIVPTMPDYMQSDRSPTEQLEKVLDDRLALHRLARDRSQACRMLPSLSLARMAIRDVAAASPQKVAKFGFWVCKLRYPVDVKLPEIRKAAPDVEAVFSRVESACPRFFPPGEAPTRVLEDRATRDYASADMKLYVMNDGEVLYKYWRALNAEPLGHVKDILSGATKVDCSRIRGRSGMPWDRSI